MSMTCAEAVFEQLYQIYLTAGHCKGQEVHIVYVNVSLLVGSAVRRLEYAHLVVFLGAL